MRPSRIVALIGIAIAAAGLLLLGPVAVPAHAQGVTPPAGADIVAGAPGQPDLLFAAAGATIYRSRDGGVTWQEAGQLTSPARSLIVTAGETPTLLAGTATAGVYRSLDSGTTWQAGNEGLGMTPGAILEVNALGADPQDPRIVYAATGYRLGTSTVRFTPVALLASVDSGASWLPMATLPLNSPRATDLKAIAGQPLSVESVSEAGPAATYRMDATAVTALLESGDTSAVRQAGAARALGLLGDASAVNALLAAAQSGDARVANAAVESLGLLHAEDAVPTLAYLLARPQTASLSTVADALAAIGTPEALGALHSALASADMTPARHAAMGALERLGSEAVPGLLDLAASESPVTQRNAVEMLGWIADPAAVDGLTVALQASDPAVRAQAAWALGETLAGVPDPSAAGFATAQQSLAAAASADLSPDVRIHATQAMSRLPQQLQPVAAATNGDAATETAGFTPVGQQTGVRLPAWVTSVFLALRWLLLALALVAIVALPWLQNALDHRRRQRPNR
ncbi:MAG: HEAT repeat domain-containing protein [Caldilineales bacterium]